MAVDQGNSIDLMSFDKVTGEVVLTISDHLEWDKEGEHQRVLQAKFNAYFTFVESGEIVRRYPEASNHPIVFRLVMKYKPDREGRSFLNRARTIVETAGFHFRE